MQEERAEGGVDMNIEGRRRRRWFRGQKKAQPSSREAILRKASLENPHTKMVARKRCEGRRRVKATSVCALIASAVAVSVVMGGGSFAETPKSQSYTGKVWDSLVSDKTFYEALEEVGAMVLSAENVDAWMSEEVMDDEWLVGAITNKEKKVLWVTKKGELEDVRKGIEVALESKGWVVASRGIAEATVDTYMKTEGECRWILAEYVQSGKETVAVLRIERN